MDPHFLLIPHFLDFFVGIRDNIPAVVIFHLKFWKQFFHSKKPSTSFEKHAFGLSDCTVDEGELEDGRLSGVRSSRFQDIFQKTHN